MKCEIIQINDRSGSMQHLKNDVIGGFNNFLDEQKKLPGEARMTYVQFDDKYEVLYSGKNLQEAAPLTAETYQPSGGTALYDAIGRTLNEQWRRIASEKWADKVIVCIITDGEENQSREYTAERIKEMISHAEKNSWSFVLLAANQDAFKTGASLGISGAHTQNFVATGAGTRSAYVNTSASVTNLRTGP